MDATSYWLIATFLGILLLYLAVKRWLAPLGRGGAIGPVFVVLPFSMALKTQVVCRLEKTVVEPWEMGLVVLGVLLIAGDASGRFRKREK